MNIQYLMYGLLITSICMATGQFCLLLWESRNLFLKTLATLVGAPCFLLWFLGFCFTLDAWDHVGNDYGLSMFIRFVGIMGVIALPVFTGIIMGSLPFTVTNKVNVFKFIFSKAGN